MTVVDTSALAALLLKEPGWNEIENVLRNQDCALPAPVLVEFETVFVGRYGQARHTIEDFIKAIVRNQNISITPFGVDDAFFARIGAYSYGKGQGNRAQLNIVDLMVYGIAKRLSAPILCTGRDFAATDVTIHPASRLG